MKLIVFRVKAEAFEHRERRAFALAVLDRPEQLMMYAQTTNDVSPPHSTWFLFSNYAA